MSRRPRRDELMALCAQLFATKGIGPTTVRDIGEASGLHSGSIYHHFRSKDDIVTEIMGEFLEAVHERFALVASQGTPTERIRGLIRETLAVIDDYPDATAMYQNDRRYLRDHDLLSPVDDASRGVREYWITALRDGVAAGEFREDIPLDVFYRSVRDALWATPHWPSRAEYSLDEFTEVMADLFLTGYGVVGVR